METKDKGVVLKLNDYKDADKLASIFTVSEGVISCKFRGVKKDKAKLKGSAQPFTFLELIYTSVGGNRTVISSDIIDSFQGIVSSYDKTICGYIVLDIINTIIPKNKPEEELFILTLNCLKNIETKNEFISVIDYIINFISVSGMGIDFEDLDVVYLDLLSGNFVGQRIDSSVEINKDIYRLLKSIKEKVKFSEVSVIRLKEALKLMGQIIEIKFGEKIKSFEYI